MSSIHSSDTPVGGDRWVANCSAPALARLDDYIDEIRPSESIEFAEDFEHEFARTLDRRGITWHYKPRTFAVEWDEDGNFIDSFTPTFFLPGRDLYIEIVASNCRSLIDQARKARLLRQQYPGTSIEVFNVEAPDQASSWLC